jgi:hypothetical protein
MKKLSINDAITNVNECMSSVFTKADVLDLLQSIELKSNVTKVRLIDFVTEYVENQINKIECDEIIDLSTAEFELNGNEITLESVDIDTYELSKEILNNIGDAVDTFMEYE